MAVPLICHINTERCVSDVFQNGIHLTAVFLPLQKNYRGNTSGTPGLHTSFVALGKSLNLPGLQFPHIRRTGQGVWKDTKALPGTNILYVDLFHEANGKCCLLLKGKKMLIIAMHRTNILILLQGFQNEVGPENVFRASLLNQQPRIFNI